MTEPDLQERRQEAMRAWCLFVEQGDHASSRVRPEILSSWARSEAAITPDVDAAPLADEGETASLWRDSPLQVAVESIPAGLPSEQDELLRACVEPISVAEVAVRLHLVVGVVQVIAGDLIATGLLDVHHTDPVEIELDMLTKMIERVRAI